MQDSQALDRLARAFKQTPEGEGVEENGDDLATVVERLLLETGRTTHYTLATPANMAAFERMMADEDRPDNVEAPRCIALSIATGEEYSGTSGDHWALPADEPLRDSEGEPMILVTKRDFYADALTTHGI